MIRIGTSGFSFPDWKGPVYPTDLSSGRMLPYYASELGFDTVEINSTYYRIPQPENMRAMAKKIPENFEFVLKGFRGMTHDPFDNRLKIKPMQEEIEGYFHEFNEALEPIKEEGKLGAVLLQYPVFFFPSHENKEYILKSKEMLENVPVVIEFRNKGWAKPQTFQFLKENGLGNCTVDEPKLPKLMPFVNEVTSNIGDLRLHGRNTNWFNSPRSERYNYLYTDEELMEFIPEIEKMEQNSEKTYVFFNNCHVGKALRNAQTLKDKLGLSVRRQKEDLFE